MFWCGSNNKVKLANLVLVLLLTSCAFYEQDKHRDARPNIIVILADDMGYSDIGVMGGEIETPALDALASEGVLFTNMYNTARCSTTRASLLTGRYSHSVGVGHLDKDFGKPGYRGFLADNAVTIADLLLEQGYRTIQVGKWHVGSNREHWPDHRGFERFYGIPKGGGVYFIPSPFLDRPIYRNGEKVEPDPEEFYSTDTFTDEAINFITKSKEDGKSFFLYLAHIAPHFPLQAPEQLINKYKGKYSKNYSSVRNARFEKQKKLGIVSKNAILSPIEQQSSPDEDADLKMAIYAAQVDSLDQNIARLVQALKDQGLYENTVIFFLSDNGAASAEVFKEGSVNLGSAESFVSYGKSWANVSNTPYREYKKYVHEGGIITPLVMSWPAELSRISGINRSPLHVMDMMPTILEIAGVNLTKDDQENPEALHGKSFWPIASHKKNRKPRFLFWEHEGNKAVRYGNNKLVAKRGQPWELYNLATDPTELNNLALQSPDVVKKLSRAYEAWERSSQVEPWPLVD